MTIFDYIKDILVTKKGNLSLQEYTPYLINRWLSFINPQVCEAANLVNNKMLLENKELHYKTVLSLFPKVKFTPKITYIKKEKEITSEANERVKRLAKLLEISEREAAIFIET